MHCTFRPASVRPPVRGQRPIGHAGQQRGPHGKVRVVSIARKAFERLAEERALVSARLGRMDEDMTELFAASRDANADDEHDPEGQTIAYERSQLAAMIRQAQAHLDEIDAAATRLAVGSYGICEVCHQPIGAERLEGKPTARTCVQHAAARL